MKRRDGSIQSSNLPSKDSLNSLKVGLDHSIYRCMITEVYYTDDSGNTTFDNKQVTYDAVILSGPKEGFLVTNIKSTSLLGGQYNYHERIFRKSINPFYGINKKYLSEQKGDIVFVSFINGDKAAPIIIGCGVSPLDKDTTGATLSDGPVYKMEYNGVYEKVNNQGEYEFVRKGGKYDANAKYFIPADRYPDEGMEASKELFQARLKFSSDKMLWEDPKSSILFEKTLQKWTHKVGKESEEQNAKDIYTEIIDGKEEKTTRTYKSGLNILEDGKNDKIIITTKGGVKITIDGNADHVRSETAAGDYVDVTPGTIEVKENGGGALKLSGGKVALGNGEEVLQILSETLQELSITLGNLGYTLSGAGTFASLKARIDSIKGSL